MRRSDLSNLSSKLLRLNSALIAAAASRRRNVRVAALFQKPGILGLVLKSRAETSGVSSRLSGYRKHSTRLFAFAWPMNAARYPTRIAKRYSDIRSKNVRSAGKSWRCSIGKLLLTLCVGCGSNSVAHWFAIGLQLGIGQRRTLNCALLGRIFFPDYHRA